ncbi:MAG: biotin--[acetyl-CoA-carboxylase] ligase [Deltaproteobacteria bacterium]|nr:biotin--[acetyl-CoA-carboxylase] ligase [Deltaproteobacteria bacterium]
MMENRKKPFNKTAITNKLETSFIGRPFYFHSNIDSTNTAAYALAVKGAKQGTAVVADSQAKGKGRLGRIWESPKGVNIYTSIILRPDISPVTAPHLTLMSAVGVAETISRYSVKKPEVKWPNDILINSKKVCGILTEMNSDKNKINFIILGIGVNLNMTKEMFPDELKPIATSIKEETGKDISRIDFLNTLYLNIEKWYEAFLKNGFAPVCEAWKTYFNMAGKAVKIKDMDREIEGIALTIDDDGHLLVREKSGKTVKIVSGDVVMKQLP